MRSTLTMVAACLLMASIVVAQPATTAEPMKMPMAGGMANMPEMTNEQMTRMSAQRVAYLREVGPMNTDLAVKEIELTDLWRADNLDAKKIAAKVNEIGALRTRLELAQANNMIAMRGMLTSEQRKAMHSGMGGMMKGSMMPGMMMQGCPMMGGGMMSGGMMGGGMMGGGMSGSCPMMRGGSTEGN